MKTPEGLGSFRGSILHGIENKVKQKKSEPNFGSLF